MRHRRRAVFICLAVASLIVHACGSASLTPPAALNASAAIAPSASIAPSGTSAVPPMSVGPVSSGGLPTQPTVITDADLAPDPYPPLPVPLLTDPIAISDAPYAPEGVAWAWSTPEAP